jgi:predicted outer membrane protein
MICGSPDLGAHGLDAAAANPLDISGAAFDRQFTRMMVTDRKLTVTQFQREAKRTNATLGQYASDSLPVLKKHLDTAEKIESSKRASR